MAENHENVYSSVGNQSEGLANAAETDLTLRPPAHIPLADITNADTMLTHYKRSREYSRALEVKRLCADVVATEDIDKSVVHSAAAFAGVAWQSLSQAIPAIQQNDQLNVIIARLDRADDHRASDQQLAAAQRASDQQLAAAQNDQLNVIIARLDRADDQRASDQQLAAAQRASDQQLAAAQNDQLNAIIARLDRADDQRASDQQLAADQKASDQQLAADQRASDQQLAADQRASDQQLAADQTASIKRLTDCIKNGTVRVEGDAISMSGVPGFPATYGEFIDLQLGPRLTAIENALGLGHNGRIEVRKKRLARACNIQVMELRETAHVRL
jgi:hypothetical protein